MWFIFRAFPVIILFALSACAAAEPSLDTWFVSATQKVFPDSEPTKMKTAELFAARNEYESVQLVLRSKKDFSGVKVEHTEVGGKPIPESWVELFEVLYVNTPGVANWGFPDDYPESRRSVYPDPLVPLTGGNRDGTISLKAGESRAVWVRIRVPENASPGDYTGNLTVTAKDVRSRCPVSLKVWPFTLPKATSVRSAIGITNRDIAKFHNVKDASDECKELYHKYYDALLDYRICAYELPYSLTDPKAKPYLLDERVNSFHSTYSKSTWEYLKELGVGEKAWMYLVDEPEKKDSYDELKKHGEYLRREMPGLRHGVPFFAGPEWDKSLTPFDELVGYIDLWVCQTDYYHDGHGQGDKVKNQMKERFAAGDETWWYVACGPREPFCNFFVNMAALQHRILFWQIYADPIITGLMYWRATHWWEVEDPYRDIATVKGIDKSLFGDGSLFYPGAKFGIDGPVPSIRLECVRDGLEDHEMLVLVEKKLGREPVEKFAKEISKDLTKYTRDPAKFDSVRIRLGDILTGVK